ncbi:hypothetical protein J5X84_16355 [Streptosporangiaceae bacterium NEAU-GS5]|nr:hypothetical protein [Streptosporangiaceae bacterium NEAU-GS5]
MVALMGKLGKPGVVVRTAGVVLVMAAAARLVAGCALRTDAATVAADAGKYQHHHSAQQPAAPAKAVPSAEPLTLDQLAERTGCGDLQVQGKGTDLHQGSCQIGARRLTLATFAADEGARAWLEEAQAYGGTYLVGIRWVVVAEPDLLLTLQGKVGGDIQAPEHQH